MGLTLEEKKILGIFKQNLKKKHASEILEVLVFGSKARGDAHKDSDIDILIVTASDDRKLAREIRCAGYDLEIQHDLIFSIQIFSKKYLNYLKGIQTQFIKNVENEAIAL